MDLRKVAHWRYEQIADLLDDSLTGHERRVLLRRIARAPVRWPSGDDRRISEATLYRWLRAYRARGLQGLMSSPRKDRGRRRRMEKDAVEKAIALLREEPRRSLTVLLEHLKGFGAIPRSTLHRHLKAHRAYARLRRLARGDPDRRLKRRFQARRPHQIWQCDAKGPFPVKLASGRTISIHVLTIIDDFSRAALAWRVTPSPDLGAAIEVFRSAARRWGLPEKFYADRASIFDAHAFRMALAELGVHRIRSKARNASARGKIEAYHRILEAWFVRELRHQVVQSIEHLQDLLTGVLEGMYLDHRHRSIQMPPREALAGRLSERQVSADRLLEAFLVRVRKKSHPKTGEVELGKQLFKVPAEFAGRPSDFAFDTVDPGIAFLERPGRARLPLKLAVHIVEEPKPKPSPRGDGRLQALYDDVRGGLRPQAEAGFGLPELFSLFSTHLGRRVPLDEAEARLLQDFYRTHGPLARAATEEALAKIFARLGSDRPLATYLAALAAKILPPPEERKPR
jgi:transposase InsO family protein